VIGCGAVLAGLEAPALAALVPAEKVPRAFVKLAAGLAPAYGRYTLSLVVDPRGVPEGLADTAFLARDLAAPLVGANALELDVVPREDDPTVLSITALAPADATAADLEVLRGQILARLEEDFPFLGEHLIAVRSPHEGADARPLPPVWRSTLPRSLGVGAMPHEVGWKNVYLVGRQNLPGLGLEGEVAAAWGAAKLVTQAEPKRDLLDREVLKS
jgi:hypothetical protein